MIIEDEADIRELLEIRLDRDDRLVLDRSFDNAPDAVESVRGCCPDGILCDIGLPGMSGLEAIPLFRDACANTVIVMYTENPDGAFDAVGLGADAVVGKDTGALRLFGQVLELLEQRTYS